MATTSMEAMEATKKRSPKWAIASKPEMIIGDSVPSWTKSIPGPKYVYDTDTVKNKAPVWSMREKPKMVMGGSVPSWVNSIPGPIYTYDTDNVKERQPVYTIKGRGEDEKEGKGGKKSSSAPSLSQDEMMTAYNNTKKAPPHFSLVSKPEMIPGEPVPSWVKSIPGPKYAFDTDSYKTRRPVWSMGGKLKSEADLMKVRSPGPVYGGAAMDAKKQEQCDSTKHRSPSTGFGIGSRWEGKGYELVRSGASARYNRPACR